MSDDLEAQLMRRAANAAATRPNFLAWAFERFRTDEQLDERQLAAWLGIDGERLPWLALCRRPRADTFLHDVMVISEQFGVTPDRLASMLRQVDALTRLQALDSGHKGLLAAAREREEVADLDRDIVSDPGHHNEDQR